MNQLKNGFIESQGVNIHYLAGDVIDSNRTTLFFVPGVMMPAWIWEKQLKHFSKNYNVVAIDPRSQGDSEQSTEGHYAYSLAKDIEIVIEKLGLQRIIVVGWSLAVSQAVNYVVHFGANRAIGLVLIDGLVGIDPSVSFYDSTVEFWTQFQVDRIEKTKTFVRSIFKQPQTEAYFERLIESALRTPTNTVMTLMENYILQDFRPLLHLIAIPTLIVTTQGPRLEYMKNMQKMIPHARIEIFDSAGHALFVDQPEKFNHLLDNFIDHSVSLKPRRPN